MKFLVRRKSGSLVVECSMKSVRIYERDVVLNAILPEIPSEGKTLTFEIKKVERNNAD